jgi:hypothetical protein
MNATEKRMFKSKNSEASKKADKGRKDGRSKKQGMNDEFLHQNGYAD